MTDEKITITQRDDGVYEARDGCHKWVSKNGIDWLQQDGKPPPLRALRSAMYRHWEGENNPAIKVRKVDADGNQVPFDFEQFRQACQKQPEMLRKEMNKAFENTGLVPPDIMETLDRINAKKLTRTERIALEGAIEDAKAGLAAGVSVENAEREIALDNELPKAMVGPRKGQVHVFAASVYNRIWRFGGPCTKQDVVWDARTGERTVLVKDKPAQDTLTDNERTALEGAIADAEKRMMTCVFPISRFWYYRHVPVDHQAEHGGSIMWNDCPSPPENTSAATRWNARTGERTVLNAEAVAEVEGYTGSIGEWPRGRSYKADGGGVIVLHPNDNFPDYFIGSSGYIEEIGCLSPAVPHYPIPGSTGRLVPEIKEDDE